MVILPFLEQDPVFLCKDPDNPMGPLIRCLTLEEACLDPVVDQVNSPPTITTEFGLYCDNAWKKGLLGTVFFVSGTTMTLIFG